MLLSRKDFVKALGASVGAVLIYGAMSPGKVLAVASSSKAGRGEKAMLYDASMCIGCRACERGCKESNELPTEPQGDGGILDNPDNLSAKTWTVIQVRETNEKGEEVRLVRKCQCMHCTNASCEAVCPTGAISHQGEAVIINQEWCIGCGYCIQACPFGVPNRSEEEGTVQKCTLCIERTTQGLEPACVEACPKGAVIYGDRAEFITEGERRVQTLVADGTENANLYGATELGGLGVIYVLSESPAVYGLPEAPQLATTNQLYKWLAGIASAAVITVVPFWWLFRRRKQLEAEQKSKVEGGTR